MGTGARFLSARTPWDTGQTGPRADSEREAGNGAPGHPSEAEGLSLSAAREPPPVR